MSRTFQEWKVKKIRKLERMKCSLCKSFYRIKLHNKELIKSDKPETLHKQVLRKNLFYAYKQQRKIHRPFCPEVSRKMHRKFRKLFKEK